MTINANEIKVYQSQDNTDNDSGGGARTSVEIVDGDVNNLLPDISRIDTVSGDVALRKVFPTVVTANRDIYYGAHAMIRKKPTDPNVSALLYHSDDPYDKRLEAQNGIESYVVASYVEQFYLFGNHVSGSKSVTFLQNLNQVPPVVGEVYLLVDGNGVDEQYIRVVDIDISEIELTYGTGATFSTYTRRRIITTIDQALEYDFTGSTFLPSGRVFGSAETFATQVADAAKFYSTKGLAVDSLIGETTVQVTSIYESIVPSTKAQSPIVNADALPSSAGIKTPSGRGLSNLVVTAPSGVDWEGKLGVGVMPSSYTDSFGNHDDGEGELINSNGITVGFIEYAAGVISPNVSWSGAGTMTISFIPMVSPSVKLTYTGSLNVNSGNQSFVYVNNISPIPSRGALVIEYRSQGKWNVLAVNNDYTIGNDPSVGSGNINDNGDGTATISLTLGSLPDLGTDILYSWASNEVIADRHADTNLALSVEFDLADTNIDPLSLAMGIKSSVGNIGTITSDVNGVLSDSAGVITGTLNAADGVVNITALSSTSRFNDADHTYNQVTIDYDCAKQAGLAGADGEAKSITINESPTGGEVNFISIDRPNGIYVFSVGENAGLEGVNLTFEFKYPTTINPAGRNNNNLLTGFNSDKIALISNNLGELRRSGSSSTSTVWGTVIADGTVTITVPNASRQVRERNGYTETGLGVATPIYVWVTAISQLVVDASIVVTFYSGGKPSSYPDVVSYSGVIGDFAKYKIYLNGGFIAGEVSMMLFNNTSTYAGNFHYSQNGVIFTGVGVNLVDKVQVGVIDYHRGIITLDYIKDPHEFVLDFFTLFTAEYGGDDNVQKILDFRTSATTIVPSSFQLRYDTENGTGNSASTDQNGNITGVDIDPESFVDPTTGMVHLKFDVVAVVTGFKYDAVAVTNLPIDAELLGLNPVRLPVDGRVPVFDSGRHLVIFDEVTTATANPTPVADDSQALARSGQSYIEVIDVNGKRLDTLQYIVDKAAGTVTFGNPLVLEDKYGNALEPPFSIVDRVEDMLLANDVQINGLITLSAALTHDYTAANSFVASALVWGDTGSRVFNLYAQEIWSSGSPVWQDTLDGDPTTAQYDDINSPIDIDNANSTSGRWAIIFKSATTVDVAHEVLGVVQAGISISIDDVAPLNPATGLPYFTMSKDGFGSGWVANNVIRFNTDSGSNNMWVIRTVQSGALTEQTDNIEIEIRGDAN